MSYVGAYPYSGAYPTVLQPRYHYPTMMDPRMMDPRMGMYGPTMPYGDGPQNYDSHTQNLLFYICSLSFMCLFVVVMVYTSIEIKRRILELTTVVPNRTADAAVSSSTAGDTDTTVRPSRWPTGIDAVRGKSDGDDDQLVPDDKHMLEDTPEERRRKARLARQLTTATQAKTEKTTSRVEIQRNKISRSSSTAAASRKTKVSSIRFKSIPHFSFRPAKVSKETKHKARRLRTRTTAHWNNTMPEWLRRQSRSLAKSATATAHKGAWKNLYIRSVMSEPAASTVTELSSGRGLRLYYPAT